MDLRFRLLPSLAPLAWVADCGPDAVEVLHGPRVEVRDGWFCEAVWDGPFAEGAIDGTDVVFGSGGRVRGDRVRFVSSGATVDRLHHTHAGGSTVVSNSLAALLAYAGLRIDPKADSHRRRLGSVIKGIDGYEPSMPLAGGASVDLVYHRNLDWDGRALARVDKPDPARALSSFDDYERLMRSSVGAILENGRDEARRFPLGVTATLSSGYDSATVAALAQPFGLRQSYSFASARGGASDDGGGTAEALGIDLVLRARDAWRGVGELDGIPPEAPFLAADAKGEDAYYASLAPDLSGRVVLTGYQGDKIWGKGTSGRYLDRTLRRGDPSGLSLTEFRLLRGFVHVPVPFIGARQISDVREISVSPEMAAWDVPGDYSRPICRRLAEEAGVPREAFGIEKKATSVLFLNHETPLSEEAATSYAAWLVENRADIGPLPPAAARVGHALLSRAVKVLGSLPVQAGSLPGRLAARAAREAGRAQGQLGYYRHLFPWAVDTLADRYRVGMSAGSARPE